MLAHIIRRLLLAIPTLIALTALLFFSVTTILGTPASMMLGEDANPKAIAELNARYQLQAMQLGSEVTYLTEGESAACVQNIEAQVQRPWDLWVEQARARRSSPR